MQQNATRTHTFVLVRRGAIKSHLRVHQRGECTATYTAERECTHALGKCTRAAAARVFALKSHCTLYTTGPVHFLCDGEHMCCISQWSARNQPFILLQYTYIIYGRCALYQTERRQVTFDLLFRNCTLICFIHVSWCDFKNWASVKITFISTRLVFF